jgi:FixJ family two-component response regulator
MPGMSGPELAQVARRLRPDLRIVLTSGYVCRDEVPDDIPFVPKPWRTGDLVDVVRRAPTRGKWGPGRAA